MRGQAAEREISPTILRLVRPEWCMSVTPGVARVSSQRPHERLKAWVACHALVLRIHRSSRSWPLTERFGLTAQARRASYSAAANIVEGQAKRGAKEFRRFLDTAIGSLAELCYALLLAKELGYLQHSEWGELEAMRDHAAKLTWGLYCSVRKAAGRRRGEGMA